MREGPDISRIAALIGDPGRANMLTALMSGKALTATELASEAGVTAQTASSHLAKMEGAGLIAARKQGRHKYIALANDDVASALEALMGLAAGTGHLRTRPGPKDPALRKARVCYNHLAGDMGIRLFESLMQRGYLSAEDGELILTDAGADFARKLGVDVDHLSSARSPICRECLDWSERRSHLAGSLGRALLAKMEELGWARRARGSRAVLFTPYGEKIFSETFPA